MDTSGKAKKTETAFRMECAVSINVRAKARTVWTLLTNAAEFPKWNSTVTGIDEWLVLGPPLCGLRIAFPSPSSP